MYEAYWKLKHRPFDDDCKTEFYYPSQVHQTALLKLEYVLERQKDLAVLAGEHGLGKTYLTHVLEQRAAESGRLPFLRLLFPQLSPAGMLAYFARRLGATISPDSQDADILAGIESRLQHFSSQGHSLVFIIDDAHLLEIPQLQTLRLLLNLRDQMAVPFSMILCGRTELLARLQHVAALQQRVVTRMSLQQLTAEETLAYAQHRLTMAGGQQPVFRQDAGQSLWELSQGIPRRINQLCDLSLLVGYVDQQPAITAVDVEAAAEEILSVAA